MKILFNILVTVLFISATLSLKGQGCSDAGFCTLNSFKPNNSDKGTQQNQVKAGISVGRADKAISVWGTYVEYVRQLNKKLELAAKITTLAQNGNGTSAFGVSDIYVNANWKTGKKIKLTIGTKLPLSDGNTTKGNLSLPMNYQASLGTLDVIVGVGYDVKRLQFIAGFQQPISQNNNRFLSDNEPLNSGLKQFQSTNKFVRSGDILLRISYPANPKNKLKVTPSLLPIYHLSNDKFTNAFLGEQKDIPGSRGLTLNVNAYFDYAVNSQNFIQLNLGAPLAVRNSKPEGLNRSFVINLEYKFVF